MHNMYDEQELLDEAKRYFDGGIDHIRAREALDINNRSATTIEIETAMEKAGYNYQYFYKG